MFFIDTILSFFVDQFKESFFGFANYAYLLLLIMFIIYKIVKDVRFLS